MEDEQVRLSSGTKTLDFRQLFDAAPGLYLVLSPDLTIVAVNEAYLRATMTLRSAILGRGIFDVFPDNPHDPNATGVRNLRSSLERVLKYRTSDRMPLQKYDIRRPEEEGGGFEERYWDPINTPAFGASGEVAYIIHCVEDVTELVHARHRGEQQERLAQDLYVRCQALDLEIASRARELEDLNRKLNEGKEELDRIQAELLERTRSEQRVRMRSEELRVTLASIGDAVIVADRSGCVTMLNPISEALTGWKEEEALGKPLPEVFRVIDQTTRKPVANPGLRSLKEGSIVGLANHTILVARDGMERAIDDCAAPIKSASGTIGGAVVVFRDVSERYAAEEALARERMLLRTLIDSLPDAIWTKGTDLRFEISNREHNEMVGQPDEASVVGKTGFDLHPRHLAEEYTRDDLTVLHRGETIVNKEELVRDPSGREQWHLAIKAPLRDRSGKITGLVGISRNIQDRKEFELALQASERRYRAYFQATTAAVLELTLDARIIRTNEAFCRMLGYSAAELEGMPIARFAFPEERAEMAQKYAQLVSGEVQNLELERRFLRKDGAAMWARESAVLVHSELGASNWVCSVAIDVTDHKNAEDFLRASEERFRLLVEGVKDYAVFMISAEGSIMTWNKGAERLFGYAATEVEGRSFSIFYTHEEVAGAVPQQHLERAATGSFEIEGWRVQKSGLQFWADSAITALKDGRSVLGGYSIIVRDITDRKRLENQFRQAQKMEAIGRLAGGVAHDFNNLLTVINGYSEMLMGEIPHENPWWIPINSIREAGERAASLTAQLLAFSRKSMVESKVLDLNDIVVQSERLLRRLIGEDVILQTSLNSHLRRVKADPAQMEQVLLNLAVNARDAMPRGGRLTIETAELDLSDESPSHPGVTPGRYVQLTVSDTGAGMTEEVKAQIFEPFFTTKEIGRGTGLGLAMVYGAVKTHRGHIAVSSELGVGTSFKILLPATESEAVPKANALRSAPRGSETVVLVEDEERVRELARITLQMHGYTVLHASSGAEGIRIVEEYSGPIDILVTDVVMPGMSGREVAEALRSRFPHIKVLYASGYTDDAVVRHGIEDATDAFLQKPFTPLGLARKVRAVLDRGK